MATSNASSHDALLLIRQSIASQKPCIPTTTEDPSNSSDVDLSLATASYLHFTGQQASLPLTTPTRFILSNKPVDLRSIYVAWLKQDLGIAEYHAFVSGLNEELATVKQGEGVQTLSFVERVDLITYLEASSEESEFIKPLAADVANASAAARIASGAVAGSTAANVGPQDARLLELYNGERKMGDRNTVLRGVKPMDFTYVRKLAVQFNAQRAAKAASANSTSLPINSKGPAKRPDPIILLSPSASSLLRMSNIKSFLEGGLFTPADSSTATSSSSASILHIQRLVPSIDTNRPLRFIIVDSPADFKPEYWARVVAVFTTGQVWQFKSYKWQQPTELFRHTLGVYVGWRGDPAPDTVRGWGRGVLSTQLEPYVNMQSQSRWRDREVVENIWKAIEDSMRAKGWRRESGPANS